MNNINPENVTTSQLVGNFTATHWIAVITTIFAGISVIVGGAYWAGQKLAEAHSLTQLPAATIAVRSMTSFNAQL